MPNNLFSLEDLLEDIYAEDVEQLEPVPDPNSFQEIRKAEEQGITLGIDPSEIATARANQDFSHEQAAKSVGNSEEYIELLRQNGVPEDRAAELASEYIDKNKSLISGQDFMFSAAMALNEGTLDATTHKRLQNLEYAQKSIEAEIKKANPNWLEWFVGGADVHIFRYFTIGIFEDLAMRSVKEGEKYRRALLDDPEEFKKFWDQELLERKSEGALATKLGFTDSFLPTDGSKAANLHKMMHDLQTQGQDDAAMFWRAMAVFDILTLGGAKLITTGAKATARGTTALAKSQAMKMLPNIDGTDVVAVTKGEDAAARVAVEVMDRGTVSTITPNRVIPETMDANSSSPVRPSSAGVVEETRRSIVFETLEKSIRDAGGLGVRVTREAVVREAEKLTAKLAATGSNIVVKLTRLRNEGSDKFVYSAIIGSGDTGKPFKTKTAALAAVKNNTTDFKAVKRAEVADELGIPTAKSGWFLEIKDTRLNTIGLEAPMEGLRNQENFLQHIFSKIGGSQLEVFGTRIATMFTMAEAALGKAGTISRPFMKRINKASLQEKRAIEAVLLEVRDGTDSALRELSEEDFSRIYRRVTMGQQPSERALDAWYALMDISNAAWHMEAEKALARIVQRDGRVLELGDGLEAFETIGYKVKASTLADNDVVLDLNTFRPLSKKAREDAVIYRLTTPYADHLYVANPVPERVRMVQKTDAYGYNAGGPRNNDKVKTFVGVQDEGTLVGGKKYTTHFKTLIGAGSEKEATTAVVQLNNIVEVLEPMLRGVKSLTQANLSRQQIEAVEAVLKNNMDWNPTDISFRGLVKVARDYNITFKSKFIAKGRDEPVPMEATIGKEDSSTFIPVSEQVNIRSSYKRGDTPFMAFGGGKVYNESPVQNMLKQFDSATYGWLHSQATQAAAVGWVKSATNSGVVRWSTASTPDDFISKILTAEIDRSGKMGQRLAEQRAILIQRLGIEQGTGFLDSVYARAADIIFEGSKKIPIKKYQGMSTDPSKWLEKTGGAFMSGAFRLKMSLFNWDQLFLQAFHVANIISISPKHGSISAGLAVPIRGLLLVKDPARRKYGIELLAKSKGATVEQIEDILDYIESSGRGIINASIIERQGTVGSYVPMTRAGKVKAGFDKFLDTSAVFFNEGELFTRITAISTAVLENSSKQVPANLRSAKGKTWLVDREQALTFRMTSSQKGAYQRGPILRVATQWLTYSNRFLENLVVGRDFTGKERRRMLVLNLAMFGGTGTGFGATTVAVLNKLGLDENDPNAVETVNKVKFGLFDYMLSQVIGEDISYGIRAAPLSQYGRTYRDLMVEKNLVSVFTGPSGEILYDATHLIPRAIMAAVDDRPHMASMHAMQTLRNVKSIDSAAKITELIRTGQYRSKKKGPAVAELNPNAAIGVALGGTPMAVLNWYDANHMIYKENQSYRDTIKELKTIKDEALNLIRKGAESNDFAKVIRGQELYEEIKDVIDTRPWGPTLKRNARLSLLQERELKNLLEAAQKLSGTARLSAAAATNSNVGTD